MRLYTAAESVDQCNEVLVIIESEFKAGVWKMLAVFFVEFLSTGFPRSIALYFSSMLCLS